MMDLDTLRQDLDLLYHFLSCHNKVYFTRKSLFLHIFPSLNEFVLFPFQLFYINFTFAPKSLPVCGRLLCQFFHCFPHRIGRKQEHSAAGVYFHMASNITQFKIFHPCSLLYLVFCSFSERFCSMAVLSHTAGTINRIFNAFCRQKAARLQMRNRAAGHLFISFNAQRHIPGCRRAPGVSHARNT